MNKKQAEERINAQRNDDFYKEKADFVILNNETESNLEEVADRIVKRE